MIQNRDVVNELRDGMLAAIANNNFPQIGKVRTLLSNPSPDSHISIQWMEQERNMTKPKWLRFFKPSKGKRPFGTITYHEILLYDFELTTNGALKKKSRHYLQSILKDQI